MSHPHENDIADWMRQQHLKVDELVVSLSGRIAAIPRLNVDKWLADLRAEFERFHAHFVKHMAVEEEGGFMAPVLHQHPRLKPEVDRLLGEHGEVAELMMEIQKSLARITPAQPLHLRDLCGRIQNILNAIEDHEEHENLLVSHAFVDDIGTKD